MHYTWRRSDQTKENAMQRKHILTGCLMILATATIAVAGHPFKATPGWGDIGREWGSTSAVYTTKDGNIWVAERCGENTCVGHEDLDNIYQSIETDIDRFV